MAAGGISGLGVGVIAGGALFVYAGLRGVSPLQALKDITSGKAPPPIASKTPAATIPEGAEQLDELDRPSGLTGPNAVLATAALEEVGKPYKFGAAGPNAFDCSGLVLYVVQQNFGVKLPHSATLQEINKHFVAVPRFEVQAGDVAFWTGHHNVIMTGNKSWVGAQNPRRGVTTGTDVNDAWTPNTPPTSIQRFRK